MSALFSTPKIPTPVVPAPAPQVTDAEAQGASNAERIRLANASGRSSTILTGTDSKPASTIPQKTLLGSS